MRFSCLLALKRPGPATREIRGENPFEQHTHTGLSETQRPAATALQNFVERIEEMKLDKGYGLGN